MGGLFLWIFLYVGIVWIAMCIGALITVIFDEDAAVVTLILVFTFCTTELLFKNGMF